MLIVNRKKRDGVRGTDDPAPRDVADSRRAEFRFAHIHLR
jgi:hypothetical protein